MVTRTFSFRAEADLDERHARALSELDRLRRERPLLADSVRYDFDLRLAEAQQRGLDNPAERVHATVLALVDAVEAAVADEPLLEHDPGAIDDQQLAAGRAAAEAAARSYEVERDS